jgi:hypothetical protein
VRIHDLGEYGFAPCFLGPTELPPIGLSLCNAEFVVHDLLCLCDDLGSAAVIWDVRDGTVPTDRSGRVDKNAPARVKRMNEQPISSVDDFFV